MNKKYLHFDFSIMRICLWTVAILSLAYIALIAVVMSYATMTVGFAQSVKESEAKTAILEAKYLSGVAEIEHIDYLAQGYDKPVAKHFVPRESTTALR